MQENITPNTWFSAGDQNFDVEAYIWQKNISYEQTVFEAKIVKLKDTQTSSIY